MQTIIRVNNLRGVTQARSACFKKQVGFTLIELMMVIAIVAILAAVAYPSYLDTIRKARRTDAMDGLLTLQNQEEKWRANNTTFNDFADATSVDGYYTLAVTVADATKRTGYILTAKPVGGKSQTLDAGCNAKLAASTITLEVNALNPRGLKTPAACWRN